MDSIAHLETSLSTLIAESAADLPRTTRTRLVTFVLTVMLISSVVVRRVAITQEHTASSTASAASHERRLRRTLADPAFQTVPVSSRVVRRILRRLPPGMAVTLAVDESGHTQHFRILLAALIYRGRAVPLAWVLWYGQQTHPNPYWTDCATLLDEAAAVLPAGLRVTVVADRAYGCPAFTDLVLQHGWDYVVRVQGQTRLRTAEGALQEVRSLVSAERRWACAQGQVFKKEGWRTASVVAYWRRGCKGPLLLVSNRPMAWDLVRVYRLRSQIEALFRDWKSSGWHWEQSQVRALEKQAVLVTVLALATVLTLCLGEETAQQVLAQAPQRGRRRPWAARDSLFRLGRDRLWQRIWRKDTSPIVWELRQADAPAWSFECWQHAIAGQPAVHMTERTGQREHQRNAA